jgi:hypothetical protein
MLVPSIPRDDDVLWPALAAALRGGSDFHVVEDGVAVGLPAVTWDEARVAAVLGRLRARPLRFVSARHGQPLAPHFAVDVAADGTTATLVELISMRFRGDGDRPASREVLRDLGVVAAAIAWARKGLLTLRTPLPPPADVEPLPEGFAVVDGRLQLDVGAF